MSFKESTPPRSQGSGSRFSLDTLRGKQHSTGSISIRFNAASADSDDEDVLYDDPKPNKANSDALQFEVKPEEEVFSERIGSSGGGDDGALFRISKSAPVSEVATPVSDVGDSAATTPLQPISFPTPHRNGAKVEPEKSIFSGLKEKLQDPIAFMEKIAAESPIIESIDRKLRKKDSLDLPSKPVKSISGTELSESLRSSKDMSDKGELKKVPSVGDMPNTATRIRHASIDNEMLCSPIVNGLNSDKGHSRSSSIDIVDDFYQVPHPDSADGMHELSATKPFVKSASSDQFTLPTSKDGLDAQSRHFSPLQKLRIKSKKPKGASERPVSVSLSGLLHNQPDSPSNDPEDDLFYDPKEDSPPVKPDVKDCNLTPSDSAPSGAVNNENTGNPTGSDLPQIPSTQKTIAAVVAIFAYLIIPLPSYVSGMVAGAIMAGGGLLFYQWWTAPPKPREPFVLPELDTLPPLKVPEMKESKNEDGNFKVKIGLQ